MNGRGPRAAV